MVWYNKASKTWFGTHVWYSEAERRKAEDKIRKETRKPEPTSVKNLGARRKHVCYSEAERKERGYLKD